MRELIFLALVLFFRKKEPKKQARAKQGLPAIHPPTLVHSSRLGSYAPFLTGNGINSHTAAEGLAIY